MTYACEICGHEHAKRTLCGGVYRWLCDVCRRVLGVNE